MRTQLNFIKHWIQQPTALAPESARALHTELDAGAGMAMMRSTVKEGLNINRTRATEVNEMRSTQTLAISLP